MVSRGQRPPGLDGGDGGTVGGFGVVVAMEARGVSSASVAVVDGCGGVGGCRATLRRLQQQYARMEAADAAKGAVGIAEQQPRASGGLQWRTYLVAGRLWAGIQPSLVPSSSSSVLRRRNRLLGRPAMRDDWRCGAGGRPECECGSESVEQLLCLGPWNSCGQSCGHD